MTLNIQNLRELKSLRLSNKIKNLKLFFQNPNSYGIIISCANLHPNARIETHQEFLMQNLKITKISNKLIKIIFKLKTKENIQHLLNGPTYLIENVSNSKDLITKNNLKTILEYKTFSFKFLYVNQQIYRSEEVFSILEQLSAPKLNTTTLKPKQTLLF